MAVFSSDNYKIDVSNLMNLIVSPFLFDYKFYKLGDYSSSVPKSTWQ